jgi:putative peptidoglycan binding protein
VTTGGDERDDERDEVIEDWFDDVGEPGGFRDPDAETWLEEPDEPAGPRDRRPLIVALAAAVVLILVGVGIARLVSGDGDDEDATPTTTAPTIATETEPTTTAETETAPSVTSTVPEDVTLKSGDSGDEVKQLQEALAALGYDVGEADGVFGAATEEAVMQFQADSGIEADGVAGPQTLTAVNEALSAIG